MAERLIVPQIGFEAFESPPPLIPDRLETPGFTGIKERRDIGKAMLKRFGASLGDWTVRPKKWKHGGETFYGVQFEKKL